MSTFLDFLIESATENAAIIALAGLVAALLTYIFRRTIREQDAMATKIDDLDAGLIRLTSDTERNETYWKLSRQVQTESLKAVIGQVEAVSVRQNFLEANVADTRQRLMSVERDHRELSKDYDGLKNGLVNLAKGHKEVQQLLQDSDQNLADFLEQSALMREDLGVLRTELLRLVDVLESAD